MLPKKKGERNIKKTKKKKSENSGNELETKYRRSVMDVAILQDHLALRSDTLLKAQSTSTDLRGRMRDMDQRLQNEQKDRRDVNSDLIRQYKTMQTELSNKVKRFEEEVKLLRGQLVVSQEQLRAERRERELVEQEKDATIADLRNRLDMMETDYEKILHDTLDSLTSQLSTAWQGWEGQGTGLQQEYKELLSDFGLNTLDI